MNATMGPVSPGAWAKSLALHGAVVALMFFIAYSAQLTETPPRIIELVAGPGDDYAAKEAPALGDPGSVKLQIPTPVAMPTPPAPQPEPVRPEPVRPAPQPVPEAVVPVPVQQPVKKEAPKTVPKKEADPNTNFSRQIQKKVETAQKKARVEAEKQRKEEAKRVATTKAEFDAKHKTKTPTPNAPKTTPGKYQKVDVKGIADGVAGGSSASTKGAGGKALTREEGELMELYYSDMLQRVRRAYEEDRPPGLSDSLKVTIEVRSNADGTLTNARVLQSSGMPEFDRAVLGAVKRVRMPARPLKNSETISFGFTMREG